MAAIASIYSHVPQLWLSGAISTSHTFKVALLGSSATFNAEHTTLSDVATGHEISGYGWNAGGQQVVLSGWSGGVLGVFDVSTVISGGDLGPIFSYVIYDSSLSSGPPLVFVDIGEESGITVFDKRIARITFPESALLRCVV